MDRVLKTINTVETGFYLTGGTASSRGYLHHRFSDDLDLFVNDDPRFTLWTDRIVHALTESADWHVDVIQKDAQFARLSLRAADAVLTSKRRNARLTEAVSGNLFARSGSIRTRFVPAIACL